MKQLIRRMSLALAVAFCAAVLAGCSPATSGSVSGSTSASGSASVAADASGSTPAPTQAPGLYVDGAKIDADPMMTIDGKDISFDAYRQIYLTFARQFDQGDLAVWETEEAKPYLETILEATESNLRAPLAVEKLAADLNLSLTDAERKAAQDEVASEKEAMGGNETFQQALAAQYLTEELYLQTRYNRTMLSKIMEQEYGEEIIADVKENFVHAQHILIQFASTEEGADHAEELKRAEEVLAKVKKGDDFNKLMEEHNEDPGQPAEGYYFTTGQMVKEFEEAAFALEDNATSEIVETSYGYHIVKRLPMEESYIQENMLSLTSETILEKVYAQLDTIGAEFPVTYSDNYDKISPSSLV